MATGVSADQDIPRPARVPRHVAMIMDGNGRWARERGMPRVKGHEAGAESVRAVVRACREWGVEAVTLFGFSTENWRRPGEEVKALMGLLKRYVVEEREELLNNGIRLRSVGETDQLPRYVRVPLQLLERDTAKNTSMTLTLALSYGGRAELVEAARRLAREVQGGRLRPDDINEYTFSRQLYTAGVPDPDLLIRTSGELRVSNFLLWQIAYAEIYVTDIRWPDFRRAQLADAFDEYGRRERRFGKTSAQLGAT